MAHYKTPLPVTGVILAGGTGSRLFPATRVVSKQLIPVYDKPMVYYPLTTLIEANIRRIVIITTPEDSATFRHLLGNGQRMGVTLSYAIQKSPGGIAQALPIAEPFINDPMLALILGDNIFHGPAIADGIAAASRRGRGASIFAYPVSDPRAYGVVEVNDQGRAVSVEEKPVAPKSNCAIPGLYMFDRTGFDRTKALHPSQRGELEVTHLIQSYLDDCELSVRKLNPYDSLWLDAGTPDSLMLAAGYVQLHQNRTGALMGSPEAAAYRNGWLRKDELLSNCSDRTSLYYSRLAQL